MISNAIIEIIRVSSCVYQPMDSQCSKVLGEVSAGRFGIGCLFFSGKLLVSEGAENVEANWMGY